MAVWEYVWLCGSTCGRPNGIRSPVSTLRQRAIWRQGNVATNVAEQYDLCMYAKRRLSASVDAELLRAAQLAVDEGRAASVSAWVNDALRLKSEHDRRMRSLDAFLAAYEAEHGVITDAEIDQATRRARTEATVVRHRAVAGATGSRRELA